MEAQQDMAQTRVFVISDTHSGSFSSTSPYSSDGYFRPPFPKADILLHSGDLTMIGTMDEYRLALQVLKDIDAELKLVIAGNHDLSLHRSYYLRNKHARTWAGRLYDPEVAQKAQELWTGPEAQAAGVTYLSEGLHDFTLKNGAKFTVYASPWQPAFYHWAFNYPHHEDRWNPPELVTGAGAVPAPADRDPHPIPIDCKIDLMMTHGPPHMHLDKTNSDHRAGCPHLLKALDRVRPRIHCFGHIHEAWGAERITWRTGSSLLDSENGRSANQNFGETAQIVGGLDDGGMGVERGTQNVIRPSDKDVIDRRAAYVDVSSSSPQPLRYGYETLLINAAVVDLSYKYLNSGWLVDLDLPLDKNANCNP